MEKTNKPWGYYEVLLDAPNCKVKRIGVKAGEQLSVQYHKKRNETWKIISGTGQVLLGVDWIIVSPGLTIEIPKEAIHSVKALEEPLVFIEVQTGEYFGEDDIIRISDKYGRI